MRLKKGVSMVILAVTIVVMAILATTAIIYLEDTGVINKSKQAVKDTNLIQVTELAKAAWNKANSKINVTLPELQQAVNDALVLNRVDMADYNVIVTTEKVYVSRDFKAPVITNSSMSFTDNTVVVDLSFGNIDKSDYPLTIDYYIKPATITSNEAYSLKKKIVVNSGTTNSYTYTGLQKGTDYNIKAVVRDVNGNIATSTLNVTTSGEPEAVITLSQESISETIDKGSTKEVTLTAITENVTGTLNWTTSDSTVATVAGSGNTATITIKAGGMAIITATYGSTSASCTVVVTENEPSVSLVSTTLEPDYIAITSGVVTAGDGASDIIFNANLNKKKASEELTFRIVSRVVTYDRDVYSFWPEDIDAYQIDTNYEPIIEEFTSTDSSVTHTMAFVGAHLFLKSKLEVLDASGNLLITYEYSNILYQTCMPAGTLILVEEEEYENGKKKKRRKKKKIEDLTYDDNLVVWDFDNACFTTAKPIWLMKKQYADEYNELTFSDGSILKTVREHRIFNKELGKFTYPMGEETKIGTTTFTEAGEEVKLVNRRVVDEKIEYYNVITNYHINAFAEGILTSCRLSNLYDIKDMKYVKDDREIVNIKEFKDIPEEYYYGLRLGEQRRNVNNDGDFKDLNSWTEYVKRLISKKK